MIKRRFWRIARGIRAEYKNIAGRLPENSHNSFVYLQSQKK